MSNFHVIIPARIGSSRLPRKLVKVIGGSPVIAHTINCASTVTDNVYVATDSDEIFSITESIGAIGIMTDEKHQSGTDRLAEAANILKLSDNAIVVNLQGDEPMMPARLLEQVANLLEKHPDAGVATLMQPIDQFSDLINPNVVKVAVGEEDSAIYFSRAPIPYPRDEFDKDKNVMPKGDYYRHIGLYAYRVDTLSKLTNFPEHPIESLEKLEQLRALANGVKIVIEEACINPEHGIDTEEDLERIRNLLEPHN